MSETQPYFPTQHPNFSRLAAVCKFDDEQKAALAAVTGEQSLLQLVIGGVITEAQRQLIGVACPSADCDGSLRDDIGKLRRALNTLTP